MPKKNKEYKVPQKKFKDDLQIDVLQYLQKDNTIKPNEVFEMSASKSKSKPKSKTKKKKPKTY
jgi:hypothetical protein